MLFEPIRAKFKKREHDAYAVAQGSKAAMESLLQESMEIALFKLLAEARRHESELQSKVSDLAEKLSDATEEMSLMSEGVRGLSQLLPLINQNAEAALRLKDEAAVQFGVLSGNEATEGGTMVTLQPSQPTVLVTASDNMSINNVISSSTARNKQAAVGKILIDTVFKGNDWSDFLWKDYMNHPGKGAKMKAILAVLNDTYPDFDQIAFQNKLRNIKKNRS